MHHLRLKQTNNRICNDNSVVYYLANLTQKFSSGCLAARNVSDSTSFLHLNDISQLGSNLQSFSDLLEAFLSLVLVKHYYDECSPTRFRFRNVMEVDVVTDFEFFISYPSTVQLNFANELICVSFF